MASEGKRIGASFDPVVADKLPADLKGRVNALIHDLSEDDLPMGLLDIAHLYRALSNGGSRPTDVERPTRPDNRETLVFNEDGRRSRRSVWGRTTTESVSGPNVAQALLAPANGS